MSDMDAARQELDEGPVVVEFAGDEYKVLRAEDWPRSVWTSLDSGDWYAAAEKVLGEQWAGFDSKHDPSMRDIRNLFDDLAKQSGFESSGNSSSSSGSSKRTGKKSKATSPSTTS